MAKAPLGKLKPSAIGMVELPRLDPKIIEGFLALEDLTGTTSDALDECGIGGAVPATTLRPSGRCWWAWRKRSTTCSLVTC